ncbi:MAG: 16S rRNA (cytidine(1402)-2'-O)-methyltransferase [Candidatus Omnitrophota bacterium]|nr:MAG: 16S rRNA (cytidine(1402)-2'-O)-methyltransferase [Candidatus Omnitrophota bacterium]
MPMLYLVATPIGNLKDITLRAIEVLQSVDMVACEDTRHSRILLGHYGIRAATTSYTQHNKLHKGQYLLSLLKAGKDVALISDAGMPGILDPGYHLINLAINNNIFVTAIPGATAFVNALAVSGKPTHRFFFEGFLPAKQGARINRLKGLMALDCTIIILESRHRIIATIRDIQTVFGTNKELVCARELTKKFEEVLRVKPAEALEVFKTKPPRGEFVIIL